MGSIGYPESVRCNKSGFECFIYVIFYGRKRCTMAYIDDPLSSALNLIKAQKSPKIIIFGAPSTRFLTE